MRADMPKWPPKRERRRREAMLADPDVQRWVHRLGKGAKSTKDVWPRRLVAFCSRTRTTPKSLLELTLPQVVDLLDRFEEAERKRGIRGTYVAYNVKVVRSWLRFAGKDLPRGAVKVREANKVRQEAALSREKLRAAYNSGTARERVAVALMATSGVRPMVLGTFHGDDGLRLRDLPDVSVDRGGVKFAKVPLRVVVREEISKAGHTYFTFLGAEGADYLRTYLETRLRGGENLGPDSAVIVPERAKVPFIRTMNIGDLVRHALRSAKLPDRPYVLRTTFAQRLLSAESEGKIPHAYAQFWMGHTGDMTARYSVNRGLLPDSTVEEMRAAYRRCEPFLSTAGTTPGSISNEQVFRVLLSPYYSAKELDRMDLTDNAAVIEALKKGMAKANAGPSQRIVAKDEAERLMLEGWKVGRDWESGRVVVERPT